MRWVKSSVQSGLYSFPSSNKTYDLVDRLGRRKDRYGASDATTNVHGILYGMYSIDYLSR